MLEFLGTFVRGLVYAVLIAVMWPVLLVFRVDQRAPTLDDGIGYDDNDPGEDVDDHQ